MKRVCAWCGDYLGEKEPLDNPDVTHSICEKCEGEQFPDARFGWDCSMCPEQVRTYRELIEHYALIHQTVLERFQVRLKKSGMSGIVPAINPDEACDFFGWKSEDCTVKVVSEPTEIPEPDEIVWVKVRCPICRDTYEYPKGGYQPPTCKKFECLHKYLHGERKL